MDVTGWLAGDTLFISPLEISLRLALAVLFGGILGLDREARNKAAGLRTHMLTALAAAIFTLLALELYFEVSERAQESTADPIRIIEAVTAGVAFLAAGVIIQSRGAVHGVTTGASMWLSAALGTACGGGYYSLATISTVLGIVVLTLLGWVERRFPARRAEPRGEEPTRGTHARGL